MNIKEKICIMAKQSIKEYDENGAHISDHLISLSELITSLENEEKGQLSIFLSESIALESIHSALSNPIIQDRIECWCTQPEYQKQTRLIIGYPMKKTVGYLYHLVEPSEQGYLAVSSERCEYVCLVMLRKCDQEENDFILYSAYPKTDGNNLWL